MKKYIKPVAEQTAEISIDTFMTTASTNHGDTIGDGGSTSGSGGIIVTGKRRDGFAESEEDDPILQLLIDNENGNNKDLW